MSRQKLFDFKYLGIALIFLVDFNLNNIDILPDFIAVALMLKAIGKSYFINEDLADVRLYLKIFCAVSVVKFGMGILYLVLWRSPDAYSASLIMVLVFVLSLFEVCLSVLIFKRVFAALEQFSYMSDSFESMKNALTVRNVMYIFFVGKFVLTFIVQTPWLLADADLDALSMRFDNFFTADMLQNMLTPPAVIIQTLFGVVMLSLALPFFFGIAKDAKICAHVDSKIAAKIADDYFFRLRLNLQSAFAFLIAGCIFFMDFRLEQVVILPDFIICVLFFLGVSQIAGNDKEMISKKLNICLIANFFVSGAAYILTSVYHVRIFVAFADERAALYDLKTIADLFYHASVILFLVIFIELYYFIKKLQHKHLLFSADYLKKYFASREKTLYKSKNLTLCLAAAAFSVKSVGAVLPRDSGTVFFLYTLALGIAIGLAVKFLAGVRDDIYNYYT